MSTLRIGCLAWGSLIWDPRTLPIAGSFRAEGPLLPIEFSRVALDGRVTLVLDPGASKIQTYWVPLAVGSVAEAVSELGDREKVAIDMRPQWIGVQTRHDSALDAGVVDPAIRETIADWLVAQPLEAVLWTALPARGPAGERARPELDSLLAHLNSLEGEALARAEEYIRRTPRSVVTRYRARFEALLGWVPTDGGN